MSLRKIIASQLPLSVHDYMQLCLQHPEYGYYRKAPAVGAKGDFTTAPEISQIFGDMIGLWWRDIWQRMGQIPCSWVELGPGRGTLSADILRKLPLTDLHLVESNVALRAEQAAMLRNYQPHWHETIDSLPTDQPLFIMANEFFDALPIRQWVGAEERQVSEGFTFTPEGAVTREECPQAQEILAALCARLKQQGGALLLVDYGYDALPESDENRDTLQAVKDHAYHDVLADCGEADLTAHVDFAALRKVAEAAGCFASPLASQEAFLRRLGGDLWLQRLLRKAETQDQKQMLEDGWLRLISPTQMGSLFKVMAITPDQSFTLAGF